MSNTQTVKVVLVAWAIVFAGSLLWYFGGGGTERFSRGEVFFVTQLIAAGLAAFAAYRAKMLDHGQRLRWMGQLPNFATIVTLFAVLIPYFLTKHVVG